MQRPQPHRRILAWRATPAHPPDGIKARSRRRWRTRTDPMRRHSAASIQTQGAGGYGNCTDGGGGGAVRHSMMPQTATSKTTITMEATTRRARSVIDEGINFLRKV